MTAAELAFDIIRRNSNGVQAIKFMPRGPKADAVALFMGRPAAHEIFITEAQATLLGTLMGQNSIIAVGGNDRFAAFVKDIFSAARGRTYFLLAFTGFVPPAPATLAASADKAHAFAAAIIAGAVAKGYAKKDDRAPTGEDDYFCTWTTKPQADTLFGLLECVPTAINRHGNILTQACGAFCYWTKAKAASGAVLLCWMGEVANALTTAPKPATVTQKAVSAVLNGKRFPADMDIPF